MWVAGVSMPQGKCYQITRRTNLTRKIQNTSRTMIWCRRMISMRKVSKRNCPHRHLSPSKDRLRRRTVLLSHKRRSDESFWNLIKLQLFAPLRIKTLKVSSPKKSALTRQPLWHRNSNQRPITTSNMNNKGRPYYHLLHSRISNKWRSKGREFEHKDRSVKKKD
jgi:hypothetical protein